MGDLPHCDKCGRFTKHGTPGSSWVFVPHSDISYGDERERCAAFTVKHGPALCSPEYRRDLCCGIVPAMSGTPPEGMK